MSQETTSTGLKDVPVFELGPRDEQEAVISASSSWPGVGCWKDFAFPHGSKLAVLNGYGPAIGAGFQVEGNDQIRISLGMPQSNGSFLVEFTNDGPDATGIAWVMFT